MNNLKVILDATPLIYLAKLGKIKLLKKLFDEVLVPEKVYQEVVVIGKKEGYSDSLIVENAIKEGWIFVESVQSDKNLEDHAPELDLGEIEVLGFGERYKEDEILLLIDDAAGRKLAAAFGFDVKGTIYVLLKGYKNGILSKKETKELLNKLIQNGFRLSPEVYSRLLKEL